MTDQHLLSRDWQGWVHRPTHRAVSFVIAASDAGMVPVKPLRPISLQYQAPAAPAHRRQGSQSSAPAFMESGEGQFGEQEALL